MRHRLTCEFRRFLAERQEPIENFQKGEDGNITTMGIFLVPLMLVLGGMSVDFMRFESERALIQDTADRAALAAANLEFTNPGEGVAKVRDFFEKANLDQYLDGDAIVTETINNRTVEVNVTRPMNTFFLKLAGVDSLNAGATSVATQGVGNVEISLVLDISGSMRHATYDADGNATGKTKMEALQEAATTFVNTALQESNQDRVSISLVPYSQHVNAGADIFSRMNTNQLHDYAYCVEFEDGDFAEPGIDMSRTYQQGQFMDHWSSGSTLNDPMCAPRWFEEINAVTQDRQGLINQIAALEPTTMTSIHLGMKWGMALLDPSARPLVAPDVDPAFAGRPANYSTDDVDHNTRKVIVVMTDGQNTDATYIKDEYYQTADDAYHWANNPFKYWYNNNVHGSYHSQWDFKEVRYNNAKGNALLADSCDAARDKNVQVFAIAFEAPENGAQVMSECATTINHFFNTNGDDLNAVFEAIAEQVTDLRLTQ